MTTIRYAVLTAGMVVLAAVSADAQELPRATPEQADMSGAKLAEVKTLVQAAVDKGQTAGAVVLVARHGKIVLLESIGKADIAAGKPMRPDAVFRIYSMTKPITSVAALQLMEDGRLKLDEPVSTYLPEFKALRVFAGEGREPVAANREVTVRDLMRHTSGLTYGIFGASPVDKLYTDNRIGASSESLADMVRKLGKLPLLYQPGTRFNYSVSTDVLGRVIEVVSGKPLDEFFRERVFGPLDLRDTGFAVRADQSDRFTTSYGPGEGGTMRVADAAATSRFRVQQKFLSGGGGLVSTTRDYLRFCQMLLNGGELQGKRLLRPETVQQMTANQLPPEALPMNLAGMQVPGLGFGLGVSVALNAGATPTNPAAGEFGWSGAASTFFCVAPKAELIVIVLQQVEPFNLSLQTTLKPVIYAAVEK